MGCYGIGVSRTLSAVVEQNCDEKGMVWPEIIAPYKLAIVIANNKDENQVKIANDIYNKLNVDDSVLLDDRNERPGVKFKDMDLIGIPVRIVVGEKNLPNVEVKMRNQSEANFVPLEEASSKVAQIVADELAKLNA
jgi:prolyl-tRNA synthetase